MRQIGTLIQFLVISLEHLDAIFYWVYRELNIKWKFSEHLFEESEIPFLGKCILATCNYEIPTIMDLFNSKGNEGKPH